MSATAASPEIERWNQWLARYEPEIVNYNGQRPDLAVWRGAVWVTNPRAEQWRELLATRLGHGWLNVAESVAAADVTGATVLRGDAREPFVKPLVRVVQTYVLADLPVSDNDVSLARELAFCLWTRRRDASPWNRAYVDGIPVFFDQHVAFEFCSLDTFLAPGPDGGYPSQWRVQRLGSGEVPTTLSERAWTDRDRRLAPHRIRDRISFDQALVDAVKVIQSFDRSVLDEKVVMAGAPAGTLEWLADTQAELPNAARRIQEILHT